MKLTPQLRQEISSATIIHSLGLILAFSGLLVVAAYATQPSWWSSPGTGSQSAVLTPQIVTNGSVVTTNYLSNNYAVVTRGQLKQFTVRAVDELNANLPGGAGSALTNLVYGWHQDYATNGYNATNIEPGDYKAMNVGQLKYIGNLVWSQLVASGYTNALPSWLVTNAVDTQLANQGQLKTVFNFDIVFDSDGSGLPDWWELLYFGQLGNDPNSSPNGNGLTLLQDYQQGNDPTNYYSQGGTIITPTLAITGGNNQTTVTGNFTLHPLVVKVTNSSGTPLFNAPVMFSVVSGGGQVAATVLDTTSTVLSTTTDINGYAQVYYLQPSSPNVTSQIGVATGDQTVTFTEISTTTGIPSDGLALWLKADAGVTADGSGNVSAWADQTGNFTVTQNTTGNKPSYVTNDINGVPGLHFSGGQWLTSAAQVAGMNSDMTIITVAKNSAPTTYQALAYLGGTVSNQCRGLGYYQSDQLFDAYANGTAGGPVPTSNTYVTEMVTLDASHNLIFYRNGVQTATGTANYVQNVSSGIWIGTRAALDGRWQGDISEVLVYSHKLTTLEMNQVGEYIGDKYLVYNPNANWISTYDSDTQTQIAAHQWTKAQADAYVAQQNSPMLVNGLALWLKADAGVTTDGSGNVSAWADQTGSFTVTQNTTGDKPSYVTNDINGVPGLHFSGGQWLTSAAQVAGMNSDMTIIAVAKNSAPTTYQALAYLGGTVSNQCRGLGYYQSDQLFDAYANGTAGGPVPTSNTYVTEMTTLDASHNLIFYRNGVQTATGTANYVQNVSSGIWIGTRAALDGRWQGDISEVLFYSHKLTTTELQQVGVYLADKYNLSYSLSAPTITPNGGNFASSVSVSFSSVPYPAIVHYTLNGTSPTNSSLQYSQPFTLTQSAPVNGSIFLDGVQISPNVLAQFYVGDSGQIGISDAWQIQYFGHTGVDPNADPDGSGLTLLQDYLQGNDPTNYYSQGGTIIMPTLTLTGGNNQTSGPCSLAPLPLVVQVTNGSGTPLFNAPVVFTVTQGEGGVAATTLDAASTSLQVTTDSNGCAQVYFQQPAGNDVTSTITAVTGGQSVSFSELSEATVATPTVTPGAGMYALQQTVTLSSTTPNVTIYYTTDGSSPTTSSPWVTSGGTVLISQSETLTAFATASGHLSSAVMTAAYQIACPDSNLPASGLVAWFEADDGVTTASGSVTQWNDLSGNAYNVTQIAGENAPTPGTDASSGNPVLQFNGNQLLASTALLAGVNDVTIITVASMNNPGSGATAVTIGGGLDFGNPSESRNDQDDGGYQSFANGNDDVDGGMMVQNSLLNINSMTYCQSSGTVSFYSQGLANGTGSLTSASTVEPDLTLGSLLNYGPFDSWNGNMAEVVIYNRVLTTTERQEVEGYLSDKYGVYSTDATWPLAYSSDVQEQITANQWNKQQADAYVALLNSSPPVPVTGLQLWLKADAGVTADDSGNVSQWVDQGPYGYNASQSNTLALPTLATSSDTGKPVVRFDGNSEYLNEVSGFSNLTAGVTVFAVFNPNAIASWARIIDFGNGSGPDNFYLSQIDTSGVMGFSADDSSGNTAQATSGTPFPLDRTQEYTGILDGSSTISLYENGGLVGQSTGIQMANITRTSNFIGKSNWGGALYSGDISEILIYNRPLTSTEQEQVEVYLADKYGLYNPNATWPEAYSSTVQAEIARNRWNKSQADGYVAFQAANPDMLTNGLQAWFKADSGVSQSGGNVTSWADQTGNFTVTQTNTTNQPSYVTDGNNGLPCVTFNGGQWLFNPASMGAGLNQDSTIITVALTPTPQTNQYMAYLGNQSGTSCRSLAYLNSNQAYDLSSGDFVTGTVALTDTWEVEAATLDTSGVNVAFYRNGVASGTAALAQAAQPLTPGVTIGAYNNGGVPYQGSISEVLVYDHQLCSDELQQVGVYLADKYGIYNPNATWPLAYSSDVQEQITANQWNKQQADAYVALLNSSPPVPVTGLQLWLKADAGVTADDSGNVSQWLDQSPGAQIVFQTVSGSEPQLVTDPTSGKPTLQFNGNQFLANASALLPGINDVTIITVASTNNLGNGGAEVALGNGFDFGNTPESRDYQDDGGCQSFNNGGGIQDGGLIAQNSQLSVSSMSYSQSSGAVAFYRQGQTNGTGSISSVSTVNPGLTIGSLLNYGAFDTWDGNISEVLIYNRILSDAERNQAEGYLADKYGIYSTDATWPLAYSSDVQEQITANQWNKQQTDAYVALLNSNPPVPVTGLQLWLKADAGVTADDNGNVSQWQDQSPSGHVLGLTGVLNPPVVQTDSSGNPTLRFNGNQALYTTDYLPANGDVTIISVLTADNPQNFGMALSVGGQPNSLSTRAYAYTGGQADFDTFNGDCIAGSSAQAGEQTVNTVIYSRSTGAVNFYLRGAYNGSGTTAVNNLSNGLVIGNSAALDGPWTGTVSEVLVYNRILCDAERIHAEGYLADKYGAYDPNATWPLTYGADIQALIAENDWSKAQADAYVASLGSEVRGPTLSPGPGQYLSTQTVTVTSATTDATIYYTTDGTDPTTDSSSIASGGQLTVASNTELKLIAVDGDGSVSPETTAVYRIGAASNLVAGANYTMVLKPDGTVWTWGDDSRGQQGDNQANNPAPFPQQVQALSGVTVTSVAGGGDGDVALAADSNGNAWAWGADDQSQCGDGGTTDLLIPTQIGGLSNIAAVYAGQNNGFAVDTSGNLYGWGDNTYGQLGDGTTNNESTPEAITSVAGVVKVASGVNHTLVLKSDGTVWATGANDSGQLGTGTGVDSSFFVPVPGLTGVVDIAVGWVHSMALLSDGTVWTWGWNSNGQLGGTSYSAAIPQQVLGLPRAVAIEAVSTRSYVILADGTVRCFGANFEGEMGIGTNQDQYTPVEPTGINDVMLLAAGTIHTVVCTTTGSFYGWGDNGSFKLTQDYNNFNRNTEVHDDTLTGYASAASGANSSMALKKDGTVWSIGAGDIGLLGQGDWYSTEEPIQVIGLNDATHHVTQIAEGPFSAFAIRNDGTLWGWGANWDGQLGVGNYDNQNTPTQVLTVQNVTSVASGDNHALIVQSDGTVWASGDDSQGELGDGTTNFEDAPMQITALSSLTVTQVAAGTDTSFALDTNGDVWAWGQNDAGQLGLGTTGNVGTPTAINGLPAMVAIAASGGDGMGIDTEGNVWSWGSLGNSDGTPLEQPGLANVKAIAAAFDHQVALETDGTLWGWGGGWFGQLGNGSYDSPSTPTQFNDVQGAVAVAASNGTTRVVKEDGSLSGFGTSYTGLLGANFGIYNYSPKPLFGIATTETPPTVSITSPSAGATCPMGTAIQFQASVSASAGSISRVEYYLEGVKLGQSTTGSTWDFSWTPPSYGDYTFEAIAYDSAGVTQISAPITVSVPYDSDGNGLPDWWELLYFGQLGNDPASSPDGNGLTLLQDYQQGNDPTNYYSQNGQIITPTLTIVSGNNQTSAVSSFTPQPLVVQVTDSSGNPLLNAPITFSVVSGGGQVAATVLDTPNTVLPTTTDMNGNAQVYYLQPSGYNVTSTITASAADQSVNFSEVSMPPAATPTVTPGAGTYALQQTVTVTSTTPSATIYYTLDGSTPNASSTSVASGGTILISQSETLNAIAIAPTYSCSAVMTAVYQITYPNPPIPTSGLTHWFKADAGITLTSADNVPPNSVVSWLDQASNSSITQSLGTWEPTYVANEPTGQPGLNFIVRSGAPQFLSDSSLLNDSSAGTTLITVSRSTLSTGQAYSIWLGNTSTSSARALGVYYAEDLFDTSVIDIAGAVGPINTFTMQVATLDSTGHQVVFYRNGLQTASGSLSSNAHNVTAGVTVGAQPGGGFGWQGDIGEIITYNHPLSTADLQQVEVYLANKYNLSLTLPTPTITPTGGSYTSSATVSFSAVPPLAVIRYTLDGTTPTSNSPIYTGSFTLTQSTPVNCAIFLNSNQISAVSSAQFYIGDSGDIGISDAWQLEYFGHTGINPNAQSPGGSGLTNLQAYLYGYNPTMYSTNGDGLSDLVNYQLGIAGNNYNISSDGLTNAQNLALGIDPFNPNEAPITPPATNPNDHTPPVINLNQPANATLLP